MKDLKLTISSFLIILSFFLWYLFCKESYKTKLKKLQDKIYYINIETKDNNLNIINNKKQKKQLIDSKEIKN